MRGKKQCWGERALTLLHWHLSHHKWPRGIKELHAG